MLNALPTNESAAVRDERALIAEAAKGDRAAARELYDAHVERVHRLTYRISGDPDLAEDLTQDVFVHVFRRLDQFRGESSFSTWVHRVALTVSLNAMRKVKRFRQRETSLEEAFHHETETSTMEPDMRDRLKAAIDMLLGIAEGTSKARVFDARARLKKMLEPHLKDREQL